MSEKSAGSRFLWGNRQIAEVTKVHAEFCFQELDRQTDAYTGTVDEFGRQGNVVDSWRRQFAGNENRIQPANGKAPRRRKLGA